MRKRTVKLWRLHEDGRKLFAGTIEAADPRELVLKWSAFLATAERGTYFATYRGSFVGPEPALENGDSLPGCLTVRPVRWFRTGGPSVQLAPGIRLLLRKTSSREMSSRKPFRLLAENVGTCRWRRDPLGRELICGRPARCKRFLKKIGT